MHEVSHQRSVQSSDEYANDEFIKRRARREKE